MWDLFPFNNYFLFADREYSADEMWDQTKAAGYDKLYFSVGRDNPDSWALAEQIPAQRRRTGLGLAAVYTVVDLTNPDPDGAHSFDELMGLLEPGDVLELALTVGWQKDVSDPSHDEEAVALARRLLPAAKQRGVTISFYHHLGFWMEKIDDCVRVARAVDDPAVGVTFCGFHWYCVDRVDLGGKMAEAAPYLKLVNVCGSRKRPEGSDFPLAYTIEPVGEGTFPLDGFIRSLGAVGYSGDVGFQGYKMGGHPPTTLSQSIGAWRAAEARVGTL